LSDPLLFANRSWIQAADGVLTAIFTSAEVYPLVLVAAALRKRLDAARWLVAISAFLSGMIFVVGVAAGQGRRFTHWSFAAKIGAPLFTINGNNFTANVIANTLLLVSVVVAVYQQHRQATRRRTTLELEFKSARELQEALIPETLPSVPGFALTSAYRPAFEVGGDFFHIIPLDADSTLVVVGDVSGKGLKAAMSVALIVGAVRTLVEVTSRPAEILAGLNRRLYGQLQGGFVTCIALRLQSDGSCCLASAGHPPPFVNDREPHLPGAFPLGLFADATCEEVNLRLNAGDYLALYTDGLLEARSSSGELYSFDRLKALFAAKPTAAQAAQAAISFGQDDDITVLTLTRPGDDQPFAAKNAAPLFAST